MTHASGLVIAPIRSSVSAAEWQARIDLAACYRLCDRFGMSDMIYTHISARVPDAPGQFLINPNGMLFSEITASSLLKVTEDGEVLYRPDLPYGLHPAGFTIHSAIYRARPDADKPPAHRTSLWTAPGGVRGLPTAPRRSPSA